MNQGTVSNAAFMATPFGKAIRDWLAFMGRVIEFNDLVRRGITTLGPTVKITSIIGTLINKLSTEQKAGADKAIAMAQREVDSDFELMHALILVAAWGSFEAFIEDVCKAVLAMDRKLLTSKAFEGVKIPASALVDDLDDQIHLIFAEASKKLNADLKIGVGKFEHLLALVGLEGNGDISDELRGAIFYAQQTRNVWAHRSGKADKRFLERCPNKGYSLGNTVKISTEQNHIHLHALMTYGVLVVNRFLTIRQLKLIPFPGSEDALFADPYAKQWGTMPEDQPITGWWAETNPTG